MVVARWFMDGKVRSLWDPLLSDVVFPHLPPDASLLRIVHMDMASALAAGHGLCERCVVERFRPVL